MRATRNATKGTPPSAKKPVNDIPGKGTPKAENVVVSDGKNESDSEVAEKAQSVKVTDNAVAKKNVSQEQSEAVKSVEESLVKTEVSVVTMQVDITDDAMNEEAEDDENDEEDDEEDDDGEDDDEDADEGDNELVEAVPVTVTRKRKKVEVFVGGLNKEATVDDVKKVFESVGDVQEVRIMTNPKNGKNKGYAFVRFATAEQAIRAATELDRTKILDKECAVVPSEENDTLFVGNICKSWSSDQVSEKLNEYGVEGIDETTLLKEPENEGHNCGHVFLEFLTHSDAVKALKRLSKPDAIFGCDRSARVAWAEGSSEPDEILLSKVKSVFVSGLPEEWEKENIKEHFGKFGAIERVVLAKNVAKSKRTDYAFVNFAARDAALASIEALKDAELMDGDTKVTLKVELAKLPFRKKRMRGHCGSYPVGGSPSKQKKKGQDKKGEGAGGSDKKSKSMKPKAREEKMLPEEKSLEKQNRGRRSSRAGAATYRSNTGGRPAASSRRGRISTHDDEDYMPLGARISPGYNAVRGYPGRRPQGGAYPQRSERNVPYSGLGAKRPHATVDEEATYYGISSRGYPRVRLDHGDSAFYSDPLRGSSFVHGSLGHTLLRGPAYSILTGDYGVYGPVSADPRGAVYPPAYYGSRGSGAYY